MLALEVSCGNAYYITLQSNCLYTLVSDFQTYIFAPGNSSIRSGHDNSIDLKRVEHVYVHLSPPQSLAGGVVIPVKYGQLIQFHTL